MNDYNRKNKLNAVLQQLFGDNRAEWPSAHFKQIFVSPSYIDKLKAAKPSFLVGGRGTGKTTSLQSLVYSSAYERLIDEGLEFDELPYLGVLVRMNKNRVRAFEGSDLDEATWGKYFTHYFNLLVCAELTDMAIWLEGRVEEKLSSDQIERISEDLCVSSALNLLDLKNNIKKAISTLQKTVNNINSCAPLILSMAESPLRVFCEELRDSKILEDRLIFCCIDEYENLLEYQQAALNTYIKHSESPLSYKVGVRKNGLHTDCTIDGQDLLNTPDDYQEIEISEEGFELFAKAVADQRLLYAHEQGLPVPKNINDFLDDISILDEALLLGAEPISKNVRKTLGAHQNKSLSEFLKAIPDSKLYFIQYWSEVSKTDLYSTAIDWMENQSIWDTRIGNHQFASLFWITRGRKGIRLRKYYCGLRVLLSLAGGNIRLFLDLLNRSVAYELDRQDDDKSELLVLSPKSQSYAASEVGKRKLDQIEGLADNGTKLKRLILALGKVFFEKAKSPAGKTPEVVSFVVKGHAEDVSIVQKLLKEGVGHLAFEVTPKNKATTEVEIRDDEYRLHPIFCGFFIYSHRKKRCTSFEASDLLAVLDENPSAAISKLLGGSDQTNDEDLPEQLAFFSPFYSKEG